MVFNQYLRLLALQVGQAFFVRIFLGFPLLFIVLLDVFKPVNPVLLFFLLLSRPVLSVKFPDGFAVLEFSVTGRFQSFLLGLVGLLVKRLFVSGGVFQQVHSVVYGLDFQVIEVVDGLPSDFVFFLGDFAFCGEYGQVGQFFLASRFQFFGFEIGLPLILDFLALLFQFLDLLFSLVELVKDILNGIFIALCLGFSQVFAQVPHVPLSFLKTLQDFRLLLPKINFLADE